MENERLPIPKKKKKKKDREIQTVTMLCHNALSSLHTMYGLQFDICVKKISYCSLIFCLNSFFFLQP